jgi:5-methylcytosine-specific restriction endonuclease McrA
MHLTSSYSDCILNRMNICVTCKQEVEEFAFRTYCRPCYNEKMNIYMKARYHRRRNEWVEKLGGKCVDCGSIENLEFDHEIAADKKYAVAKMLSGWSEAKLTAEISKCVLRCQSCHLKKSISSGDIRTVNHGEGVTGKKNCRCDLCRPLKNAYLKEFMKNKRKKS